jgi:hypothetical protein
MSFFNKLKKAADDAQKAMEQARAEIERVQRESAMGGSADAVTREDESLREPERLDMQRPSAGPTPQLPRADRFAPEGGRAYRIVTSAAGNDPRTGKRVIRSGVGVSLTSRAEAEAQARERAQALLQDALAGREPALGTYGYHADKKLEPLVDAVRGPSGDVARITVNGYGSLVINANAAMFADVDTGGEVADPRNMSTPRELTDLVMRRPDLGFRVYRTLAGWRYLCTTTTFDPASDEVRTLLRDLGSDEKYVTLCRIQKTFRARLTPKPWRARESPVSVGADGISRSELQSVIDRTWRYATARYVTAVGSAQMDPGVAPVVDAHDAWTQAATPKPLA